MKKGFTFIEIIVVLGIITIVLPALFSIIFVILQQQNKVYRLSQVKREGDYALSIMEHVIRNYGTAVYYGAPPTYLDTPKCDTAGSSAPYSSTMYLKDIYGNWLHFYTVDDAGSTKIASESAQFTSGFLTTNKVKIINYSISCSRTNTFSPPLVTISFTAQYNTDSTDPKDTASLTYQTSIKLRN
ncbi:MAG: type II secretion system protein [bacterium]|nr:type II secretion system protein [bacterium]